MYQDSEKMKSLIKTVFGAPAEQQVAFGSSAVQRPAAPLRCRSVLLPAENGLRLNSRFLHKDHVKPCEGPSASGGRSMFVQAFSVVLCV